MTATATVTTPTRFYDLQDEVALTAVLKKMKRNVRRGLVPSDITSAVARAEVACSEFDFFKKDREARDIHIRINPERNRQPKARSYNGWAMAVEAILMWDTKANAWYLDLDASGASSALSDTVVNRWDSQVVVPDAIVDTATALRLSGIGLGE